MMETTQMPWWVEAGKTESYMLPDGTAQSGFQDSTYTTYYEAVTGPIGISKYEGDIDGGLKLYGGLTIHEILYYLIGSIGMALNGFVVMVFLSNRTIRRKATNVLIVNQCITDFTTCLFIAINQPTTNFAVPYTGLAGEVYCRLWMSNATWWALSVCSTFGLMAITSERYLAIVHPLSHRVYVTKKQISLLVASVWAIPITYIFLVCILTSRVEADGTCNVTGVWPSTNAFAIFGIIHLAVSFIIPAFLMLLCYSHMTWVLKKSKKSMNQGPDASNKSSLKDRAVNNIFKTLVTVFVFFMLCWTWTSVYLFLVCLSLPLDWSTPWYYIGLYMYFCNHLVNPMIYCVKYEQFQESVKQLFCKKKYHDTVSMQTSSSVTSVDISVVQT